MARSASGIPAWAVAASLLGWAVLLSQPALAPSAVCVQGAGAADWLARAFASAWQSADGAWWRAVMLMSTAMVLPAAGPHLAEVWDRSTGRRRARAVLLFGSGFLLAWTAALACLTLAAGMAHANADWAEGRALCVAAALAAAWHGTPLRQAWANRGHARGALPAFGLRADAGSAAYGLRKAALCIGSCWTLMLVPLASQSHHLPLMAAASLAMAAHRRQRPLPACWDVRWLAAAAGLLALAFA